MTSRTPYASKMPVPGTICKCGHKIPRRSSCTAAVTPILRAFFDDLVDQPKIERLGAFHEIIPVGVVADLLQSSPGMLDHDLIEPVPHPQDFARVDVDIRGLALEPAHRLLQHDPRVRQRKAFTSCSASH